MKSEITKTGETKEPKKLDMIYFAPKRRPKMPGDIMITIVEPPFPVRNRQQDSRNENPALQR